MIGAIAGFVAELEHERLIQTDRAECRSVFLL
jgi:hypothetical protein